MKYRQRLKQEAALCNMVHRWYKQLISCVNDWFKTTNWELLQVMAEGNINLHLAYIIPNIFKCTDKIISKTSAHAILNQKLQDTEDESIYLPTALVIQLCTRRPDMTFRRPSGRPRGDIGNVWNLRRHSNVVHVEWPVCCHSNAAIVKLQPHYHTSSTTSVLERQARHPHQLPADPNAFTLVLMPATVNWSFR